MHQDYKLHRTVTLDPDQFTESQEGKLPQASGIGPEIEPEEEEFYLELEEARGAGNGYILGDVIYPTKEAYDKACDEFANWMGNTSHVYVPQTENDWNSMIADEYDYPEGDSDYEYPADCSDPYNPVAKEKSLYPHYFKPCPYSVVDIYRVIRLFDVADPCIQHALKKLLAAGRRGAKDLQVDIQEAIDSLERWKAMATEDRIYNNKEVE